MIVIGISIKKNEIFYAALDGQNRTDCIVVDVGKITFRSEIDETELMFDFYNLFNELFSFYKPDRVAYKLYLNPDIHQIPYMHFSLGVLNFLCKQKGIPTTLRSGSWITSGKGKKTIDCEACFGQSYKKDELTSILVAWHEYRGWYGYSYGLFRSNDW